MRSELPQGSDLCGRCCQSSFRPAFPCYQRSQTLVEMFQRHQVIPFSGILALLPLPFALFFLTVYSRWNLERWCLGSGACMFFFGLWSSWSSFFIILPQTIIRMWFGNTLFTLLEVVRQPVKKKKHQFAFHMMVCWNGVVNYSCTSHLTQEVKSSIINSHWMSVILFLSRWMPFALSCLVALSGDWEQMTLPFGREPVEW